MIHWNGKSLHARAACHICREFSILLEQSGSYDRINNLLIVKIILMIDKLKFLKKMWLPYEIISVPLLSCRTDP